MGQHRAGVSNSIGLRTTAATVITRGIDVQNKPLLIFYEKIESFFKQNESSLTFIAGMDLVLLYRQEVARVMVI